MHRKEHLGPCIWQWDDHYLFRALVACSISEGHRVERKLRSQDALAVRSYCDVCLFLLSPALIQRILCASFVSCTLLHTKRRVLSMTNIYHVNDAFAGN